MSAGLLMILAALILTGYNIWQEQEAKKASGNVVEQMTEEMQDNKQTAENSSGEKTPSLEMPAIEIDGKRYIAVLELPTLGLELPVMEKWSYPNLRVAPCRYTGSIYTKDLIIAPIITAVILDR